ncbi:SPOSA6832_01635 [Sporobolomyces salmonicolor]|uniref:SPOSA6832_01635-mRNA-1:cds n=1 Tax=Sporidiobolus salmonicolor TaxID=5005 RepID=A0A0D6EJA6_SPOSA|nr:SPOSA6832_01635 [Sporobolomyces salmonicolor]
MSTDSPVTKKPRSSEYFAVHAGTFHADEALAVFLLRLLPRFASMELKRSRDPAVLEGATLIADVGGVYDPETLRFDHHQRGFNEVFGHGFKTKLSSAGLVYKCVALSFDSKGLCEHDRRPHDLCSLRHFGKEILSTVLSQPIDSPLVSTLFLKMYADFVEAFDGIDNGVTQYVSSEPPLYRSRTDISSRVGALNPRWNEESSDAILDQRFEQASQLAGKEFLDRLDYLEKAWLPAREIVQRAVEKRKDVHPSGKVLVFDEFAPWKEHLHILEQDLAIPADELPLYALYPEDSKKPESKWRIQAVPVTSESFESRKALPEAWRGVRDDQLSQLTGIDGCVFVHAAGFIGGNATKDGAMTMAIKALEI